MDLEKGTLPQQSQLQSESNTQVAETSEPIPRAASIADSDTLNGEKERKGSLATVPDPNIVGFAENDPENPKNWSNSYKWFLTIAASMSTLCVAYASSAYTGAIPGVMAELGASETVATLGVTFFVVGFATGPLIWAPLSEQYGRYPVYAITLLIYTIFFIPAALAKNIPTLLVARLLGGIFGSSPITNAGGTLSDIWDPESRGKAMVCFAMAPFLGPIIGPITSDFISTSIGWRWTFWVEMIFSGAVWAMMCLCVPETLTHKILKKRAAKLRKETGNPHLHAATEKEGETLIHVLKDRLSTPWVILFREPIVLLITIYMAFVYGLLYLNFSSFPFIFENVYHFPVNLVGLSFIGVGVGIVLAAFLEPWQSGYYHKASVANGGKAPPEARLPGAFIGAVCVPVALFWMAWTSYASIHWIVPIIGSAFFGAGMLLIFLPMMNYIVDAYSKHAASALAANTFLRSLFGAGFPLFANVMYTNLGVHWASTVLAFIALILLPIPFLFFRFGASIRARSKFALGDHQL